MSIASRRSDPAFTLLEVMIAMALFFMVVFAILALTSQSVNQARALRFVTPPIGSLASETSLTNQLEEGFESGDFGDTYPNHEWNREVREYLTNGLFQVDLEVIRTGKAEPEGKMSILLFRPESMVGAGRLRR